MTTFIDPEEQSFPAAKRTAVRLNDNINQHVDALRRLTAQAHDYGIECKIELSINGTALQINQGESEWRSSSWESSNC